MAITVFISTVTDEFRSYRDLLVHDLTRQNVAVKVQEDFKEVGDDTLDKLDMYIAECDVVVHLVGDMCGAEAADAPQRAFLRKHFDLADVLPPLGEALRRDVAVSYTQWEAWLALYHGKQLRVATPHRDAPRGPNYKPTDASKAAQEAHLARLREAKRYPFKFKSPDDLAKQVLASGILDLLAEDRAAQASVPRQEAKIDEILRRLSQSESVPLDTLRAILSSMGEAAAAYNAGEIEQKLVAKASEFRDLTDRLNRLSNADPVVTQLRAQASTALAGGLFDRADQYLADAEARDLSGVEDIEALARQKRLSAADSRAQRAATALLHVNPDAYRKAAEHYGEASSIAATADALKPREYLRLQAAALVRLGQEFGDNPAFREAIGILRAKPAAGDKTRDPLDWAATQHDLGVALTMLGQREIGPTRLEEAVKAFRAALEEYTRERDPFSWATTQMNLGNALGTLGDRESRKTLLEEAVVAYRSALEEYTRDQVPLDWARAQMNLGVALTKLGRHASNGEEFELAIRAFREALQELTRQRAPLDWAITHMNLGTALVGLDRLESSTGRLKDAVAAYRSALQELVRKRVPLEWAGTQNNLGAALVMLGERDNGTERLEEAISAYRASLKEYKRKRIPLEWARVQNNLGNALTKLGEREHGTARLEEAVSAYGEALKVRKSERLPSEWAESVGHQALAMIRIADRTTDSALAERAAAQLESAFGVAAYQALRAGGQHPWAVEFFTQLPKAQAIRDRLRGK